MLQKPKNAEAFGLEAALHSIIVPTTRWPERCARGLNLPPFIRRCLDSLPRCQAPSSSWTTPDNQALALNTVPDLARSKSDLVLENELLRQQLIVLQRQGNRPTLTWRDRALSVLMAITSLHHAGAGAHLDPDYSHYATSGWKLAINRA